MSFFTLASAFRNHLTLTLYLSLGKQFRPAMENIVGNTSLGVQKRQKLFQLVKPPRDNLLHFRKS